MNMYVIFGADGRLVGKVRMTDDDFVEYVPPFEGDTVVLLDPDNPEHTVRMQERVVVVEPKPTVKRISPYQLTAGLSLDLGEVQRYYDFIDSGDIKARWYIDMLASQAGSTLELEHDLVQQGVWMFLSVGIIQDEARWEQYVAYLVSVAIESPS